MYKITSSSPSKKLGQRRYRIAEVIEMAKDEDTVNFTMIRQGDLDQNNVYKVYEGDLSEHRSIHSFNNACPC